jgi:hypothetical protein
MPKSAAALSLLARPPSTPSAHAATSLMDDLQFMAELETMEALPKVSFPPTQLLGRARKTEDGFVAGQTHLHVHASERSHTKRPRLFAPDRNTFQPAPLEADEEFDQYQHDDETSVTISARVAAFAIMASGLAGVGAAALVFHARLALFLQ